MKPGVPEPIAALNRIRIIENNEPLVEISKACPDILVTIEKGLPMLRKTVANMLNQAQTSLPPGYRLWVRSALRDKNLQKKQWDAYFAQVKAENPTWPKSAICRKVNKFYAPYDQPAPPGHSTGAAVDVLLQDPEGNQPDYMFPLKDWSYGYTYSDKISPEIRAHRNILINAMLGAGFSNCKDEYWHYSYGDSAWAVRTGKTECCYGAAPLPE